MRMKTKNIRKGGMKLIIIFEKDETGKAVQFAEFLLNDLKAIEEKKTGLKIGVVNLDKV